MSAPAFEIPGFLVGVFPANSDLSGAQYKAMDLVAVSGSGVNTAAGAALALASAGYPALGILQNAPVIAEAGTVMVSGISKALIGTGGCTVGQLLAAGSDGLVVATGGAHAIAKALSTASATNVAAVLLKSYGVIS